MSDCTCRGCTRQRDSVRGAIGASWERTKREANVAVVMSAATMAGMFLALSDGLANEAIRLLPAKDGEFWGRVHATLRQVSDEDPSIYGPVCEAREANVIPIRRRR